MNVSTATSASRSAPTRPSIKATIYVIDPKRCTECVGHFDQPQCVEVCPVACIITDPCVIEIEQQLRLKYQALIERSGSEPERISNGPVKPA